jgi:hypothetical protein
LKAVTYAFPPGYRENAEEEEEEVYILMKLDINIYRKKNTAKYMCLADWPKVH